MAERKAVSKRTRFEVFKRDGFRCAYCGRTPPDVLLHIDHVLAVANGGGNEIENLITACQDCNLGKSAVPLTAIVRSLELQADEALERAEQIRAYAEAMKGARSAKEEAVATMAAAWFDRFNPDPAIQWSWPEDRQVGMRRFLELLPVPEILEAMDIAAIKARARSDLAVFIQKNDDKTLLRDGPVYRYFCGICWSKIRERKGE